MKPPAAEPYILVVEDNSGDAVLIRQSLEEHGVLLQVVVLTDGEEAVRLINDIDDGTAPCPALVILDLNLPKRTGREVLERLRKTKECVGVPVAVFSSSDAAADRQAAERLGANQYVKKSIYLDDFLRIGAVVKSLLQEARG